MLNEVHQAHLLFLSHDKFKHKTYTHSLTVVDVASHYKETEPLTPMDSTDMAVALNRIYNRGPMKSAKVDPGREFVINVSQKHKP